MKIVEGEVKIKNRYGVNVMSSSEFVDTMKRSNITDDNIEDYKKDFAIISITEDEHYFKKPHSNVLNIEFYDIDSEMEQDGKTFKPITTEQAEYIIRFIELNKEKNFIIHCLAGISRSGAVAQFLTDFYPWTDKSTFKFQYGSRICPNAEVLKKLKEEWMRLYSKLDEREYMEMLEKNKTKIE